MARQQDQIKVMSSEAIRGASRISSKKLGTFSSGFSDTSVRSTKVVVRTSKKAIPPSSRGLKK